MLTLLVCTVADAVAQRPFRSYDPFYRDEAAHRTFFDGYAVTAEFSYRPAGTVGQAATTAPAISAPSGALGLAFHIEYKLMDQLDLYAILDASGGMSGESATLSWIALKRYWHSDGTNFALRLAFDPRPAFDGKLGFRQTDLALFYNTTQSPMVSMDLVGGFRQVRIGYQRLAPPELFDAEAAAAAADFAPHANLLLTQTEGVEAHLMIQYNMLFDPAQSHVFAALLYEGGQYTLNERALADPSSGTTTNARYQGHVIWIRTGVRWNRPSYKIAPFLSVPIISRARAQNLDVVAPNGKGPKLIQLGLRLTLR